MQQVPDMVFCQEIHTHLVFIRDIVTLGLHVVMILNYVSGMFDYCLLLNVPNKISNSGSVDFISGTCCTSFTVEHTPLQSRDQWSLLSATIGCHHHFRLLSRHSRLRSKFPICSLLVVDPELSLVSTPGVKSLP